MGCHGEIDATENSTTLRNSMAYPHTLKSQGQLPVSKYQDQKELCNKENPFSLKNTFSIIEINGGLYIGHQA